jgi:3-oxoacyl-[acyl-carrier-protein] synthase-3
MNGINNVKIAGIASAIPDTLVKNSSLSDTFAAEEISKICKSTGVQSRAVSNEGLCTSDLCVEAAEKLLKDLNWERESIDLLVFVSQTPDYVLPATACSLQNRLQLSKQCMAFDINLGCSGYTYGLSVVGSLINSGSKRALLLVGDTSSKLVSPKDRSTALLFGDSGTATALEHNEGASFFCDLGTDGSGSEHLIIHAGASREPLNDKNTIVKEGSDGNLRARSDLYMNGAEVFTFTLREVPNTVSRALSAANLEIDDIDYFVFHQANEFMLKHIAKRMKIPAEKFITALESFGNTSSASIPLTIVDKLSNSLSSGKHTLCLCGFGVGLSWGTIVIEVDSLCIPSLIQIN